MAKVKRALVSVSDKQGIVEFCKEINQLGIEILSTGGTAKLLAENNINVIEVSDYTGFPEMMDGRLKTLHPKVFGGILCRHDRPDDMTAIGAVSELRKAGIDIPNEIAITGFEDIELASVTDPPLTTVRQPTLQMGSEAMALLLDLMSPETPKPEKPVIRKLAGELVVREST